MLKINYYFNFYDLSAAMHTIELYQIPLTCYNLIVDHILGGPLKKLMISIHRIAGVIPDHHQWSLSDVQSKVFRNGL